MKYTRCKKDKFMKTHFIRRFRERFGINITDDIYNNMIKQIRNPDIDTFVCSQSSSRKIHKVKVNNEEYLVVYNPIKRHFHTVLPKGGSVRNTRVRNDSVIALSGYSYGSNIYDIEDEGDCGE